MAYRFASKSDVKRIAELHYNVRNKYEVGFFSKTDKIFLKIIIVFYWILHTILYYVIVMIIMVILWVLVVAFLM